MSPDSLSNIIAQRDRENARRHRLEPERLVMATRPGASARYACRNSCGYVVSALMIRVGGHLDVCPDCGVELVLVEG